MNINYPLTVVVGLALGAALISIAYFWYIRPTLQNIKSAKAEIGEREEQLRREIEAKRKEILLEAKEEAFKIRAEIEKENKDKRAEIQRLERRLA
ncbi:MAG: Rnase Y domain-containing protein, partial [Candidatus Hadarchaeum sp.]